MDKKKIASRWLPAPITEMFGLDRRVAIAVGVFTALTTVFAVFWFFHSAPPMALTITSGPEGSSSFKSAQKYADILKRSHIKTHVLTSEGSLENLQRLSAPGSRVDVGFVQGGVADASAQGRLVSLGSINHQPLLIFYRAARPLGILSQLAGKRLAIGNEGSGARMLALALLADNGIKPGGKTTLVGTEAEQATKDFLAGKLDAVFLMGDSAPSDVIRELFRDQKVRLFSFAQADGYVRRFNYLNKIVLPRGAIDFGKDIPPSVVDLIGPAVELVAQPKLDPALNDLLLDAAREVHGGSGLFRDQGEFPSLQEHEFRASVAAQHFYKSGKSFFYRFLPFWAASLVDRILVTLVPLLVILIPGLRIIPAMLRWRINLLIYRWYRMLLKIEHEGTFDSTPEKRQALLLQIDQIEDEINRMKVPVAFATQFYELRGHINFVRGHLTAAATRG
ncbi:MAG: TAXI family TRAP transporter solute-binding subunit [Elusimicrobiota bacterium]